MVETSREITITISVHDLIQERKRQRKQTQLEDLVVCAAMLVYLPVGKLKHAPSRLCCHLRHSSLPLGYSACVSKDGDKRP